MSLPHILKHIYKSGSEEAIIKGKRIFQTQGVRLIHNDPVVQLLTFRVRNDVYRNYYNVTITNFSSEENMELRCKCAFNTGKLCRHESAALFYLNELLITNRLQQNEKKFDQKNTVIKMRSIDLKMLRIFTSEDNYNLASEYANLNLGKIMHNQDELIIAEIPIENELFTVELKRNDNATFSTKCNCNDSQNPLCVHKTTLFLQLLTHYGENYFDSIRNWDFQKNRLLNLYGFSLQDDLEGKFEFYYVEGKPFLKVLDKNIKKLSDTERKRKSALMQEENIDEEVIGDLKKNLGIIIVYNKEQFPHFEIKVVEGEILDEAKEFGTASLVELDISRYFDTKQYSLQDRSLIQQLRKLNTLEIEKFIARHSPYGDLWKSIKDSSDWTEENKILYYEYTLPKFQELMELVSMHHPLYILPDGKAMRIENLKAVKVSLAPINIRFRINGFGKSALINTFWDIESETYKQMDNEFKGLTFYLKGDIIYCNNLVSDIVAAETLYYNLPTRNDQWNAYLQNTVMPISQEKAVLFNEDIVEKLPPQKPELGILLSERSNYFVLTPVFNYYSQQFQWNKENEYPISDNGKVRMIQRDKAIEKDFVDKVASLHPKLQKSSLGNLFLLESKFALAHDWMFTFFDKVKEWGVNLFGYEQLDRYKIKKAKPSTQIHIQSGIDWFDTQMNIEFEEQKVSMFEIQKILRNKENLVKLDDGTYGLLPEEWLKKYSLLFKISNIEGDRLRTKKVNFHIINDLYDAINQDEIKQELEERKESFIRAQLPEEFNISLPENLNASLRPYQQAGFEWLGYLSEQKWGGLLADDMGLGKTLQTLVTLLHYLQKKGKLNALVVCPTSLLFNWKNEIEKFTPDLSYYIHHGNVRTSKFSVIQGSNIVLTSYGTLRSDIHLFQKIQFDYVILDESQMIKNPASITSRACYLLKSDNKLALSGTPMQNNTFDIYSQMHFLNPGMLGSKEFFKDQFAVPIDRFQDAETKTHLKKLLYPFLLRRTKEQVAKDLPEKTEITLTCEMDTKQMRVYNQHKNLYRSKILGELDNKGISRSQFSILQGLMRLRQICDSPMLIDAEEYSEIPSTKIDLLAVKLESIIANHKVLIFSQFLGMLSLIKNKLSEMEIPFQYFDGSSTTNERQNAIEKFQNDDSCRAFVISLKAGGMGLNLTAADYVFLIDPWWNPAIEQQAIDRTHRIGQTKNIFAYRFICKDTVEEKIMQLKEKKNQLVKEIISDDSNFIKTLTREDIEYLFS